MPIIGNGRGKNKNQIDTQFGNSPRVNNVPMVLRYDIFTVTTILFKAVSYDTVRQTRLCSNELYKAINREAVNLKGLWVV